MTHWNAYLPIGKYPDELGLDPSWAAAMGVDKDALSVLRAVRREVLPLVRKWDKAIQSFSFLVHDRASGVPCPPEDTSSYIHLRLVLLLPKKWLNVWSSSPQWIYVSGVEPSKGEILAHEVLAEQSAWYLRFLEKNAKKNDVELLLLVGQQLHFYANMAQMMVR